MYYNLNVSIEEKQKNLEIIDINKKIQNLLNFFSKELNFSALEKKIKNRVKRQMEKTQREYYLNEQMKAIQKELGDGEDGSNEYTEIEKKINEVKLSKEAKEKALNEFKKLKSMSPMSAEASVIRNYLEWLLDIPWESFSKEINDISGAEKILNQDHYGLEKVKERILEFLAVKKRSKKRREQSYALLALLALVKLHLVSQSQEQQVESLLKSLLAALEMKLRLEAIEEPILAQCLVDLFKL